MYPSLSGLRVGKLLKDYPVLIYTDYGPPMFLRGNGKTIGVLEYKLSEVSPVEVIENIKSHCLKHGLDFSLVLVSVREEADEVFFGMYVPGSLCI